MLSRIRRKNSINPICNLHFVRSLHFPPGLKSAVCIPIDIAVFVRASPKSRPKYWSSKKDSCETILAAMIDMWTVCWRAQEKKYNDKAMINLYRLKTIANVRLTKMAFDALSRGNSVWKFRLLDSSCIFRSSEMLFEVIVFIKPYEHFISFYVSFWASSKLILIFTKWGGVACETTSVHGPQCNFRHGRHDNFRQHLLHHDVSFIAFSVIGLKMQLRFWWGYGDEKTRMN